MLNPVNRIAPWVLCGTLLAATCTASADVGLDMDSKYLLGTLSLNSWSNSLLFGVGLGAGVPLTGIEVNEKVGFAIETGVNYFGGDTKHSGSVEYSTWSMGFFGLGKGRFELQEKVHVFAKLGTEFWFFRHSSRVSNFNSDYSSSGISMLIGFGGEYELSERSSVLLDITSHHSGTGTISVSYKLGF